MKIESSELCRPPRSIVEAVEDSLVYFAGVAHDEATLEEAKAMAEELWRRLGIAATVEAVSRQVPSASWRGLNEDKREAFKELVNTVVTEAVDEIMLADDRFRDVISHATASKNNA
jgi:CO/xanthine dehydrogenase FAD-binding subunit